ncbi:MAG: hypothetical protein WC992_00175 [Acholeplasmataceae bacterium]
MIEIDKLLYMRNVQDASAPFASNEYREQRAEVLQKTGLRLMGLYQPWLDVEQELKQAEQDAYQRDLQTWESNWGRMDDPEILAETARLAEALKNGVEFGLPEGFIRGSE